MTQENIQNIFAPNKDDMRKHIEFIMSGMHDYKDGKIEIAYGDHENIPNQAEKFFLDTPDAVDYIIEFAEQKNKQGRNIYIVGSYLSPDAPIGGRSKDEMFYATNSIWVDIDNAGENPITVKELRVKYAHCRPHMVIVTGRTPNLRTWLWWKLLEPITKAEDLERVLTGVIQNLDGDPSAKNASRLTRLGGSVAWPTGKKAKAGRITEVVETTITGEPPISVERLTAAYPIKKATPKSKITGGLNFSSFNNPPENEIKDMLAFLSPAIPRKEWLDIGMALHDGGYDFSVWNEWSKGSPSQYNYDDTVKDWNSFEVGKGITLGTLIQKARDVGYMRVSEPFSNMQDKQAEQPTPPPKAENSPENDIFFTGLIRYTIDDMLAKSRKPQPELAMLNVLSALGAVFGRRYRSPMNTRTNLYTVGIAPTGSGKDFSRKYIKTLMIKAGLSTFLGADSIVSGAGIITSVERNPSQIMHLDEFGMLLADIKNKNTASHMKVCAKILTEFYSTSSGTYYGGHYADKKLMPTKIIAPNLCIYGTTTMANYANAMDRSVIESGELNRYIIIKPLIEWPQSVKEASGDATPSQNIIDAWTALAPSFGANNPADETPPITVQWDWQEDRLWAMQKFQDNKVETTPNTGSLWVRYVENVIKIAMIMCISRNQIKPYIETSDLDTAEGIVKRSIEFMETMSKDNMADSEHERVCNAVLEVIRKYGAKMPKRELSNRTRNLDMRQRDEALKSLDDRGAVLIEQEKNMSGVTKYFLTAL